MSRVGTNLLAGLRLPAPGVSGSPSLSGSVLSFVGLAPYIESPRTQNVLVGASTQFGHHVVFVQDRLGALADGDRGRYMELYTISDSALPADSFHSSGRRLIGRANAEPPDFAAYQGFVGMVDGEGRTAQSGDGRLLDQQAQRTRLVDNVQLLNVTEDSVGAFTTNIFTQFGSGPEHVPFTTSPGVGAAEYYLATTKFGRIAIRRGLGASSTLSATVVWEYFNGTAFVALSNVTDGTSNFSSSSLIPQLVDFDIPDDWVTTTINSQGPFFFVRARMTAFVSGVASSMFSDSRVNKALQADAFIYDDDAAANVGQRVGDVVYFGTDVTISQMRLAHSVPGAGSITVVWEYFNGTVFVALSGVTDGTSNFSTATTPQNVSWTVPGDWATTRLAISDPLRFFVRARISAIATQFDTQISTAAAMATLASITALDGGAPVAYDIGTKPGVDGERAPEIIPWGIALPAGIVANAAGLHTYWDPIRQIHSRRFLASANNNYLPVHGEPSVPVVAQWSNTTTTATLAGTAPTGTTLTLDTSKADTSIQIGVDSGPPVLYDETLIDRDFSLQGTTTCVLRNRVYVARGNRVIWCERGEFHQWAAANGLDIAPNDGDEITAIFAFAEKVFVFKRHHVYLLAGEPSIGTTGLQVLEMSNTVGCIALKTIVDVGAQLLFLSQSGVQQMDTSGIVQPIEVSEPVRQMFEYVIRTQGTLVNRACAAWEPSKTLYLIALPGIIEQLSDSVNLGANPAVPLQPFNDGILAYCRRNGQWAVWPGPESAVASLATSWKDAHTREVIGGGYYGQVMKLVDQAAPALATDYLGDFSPTIASHVFAGLVDAGSTSTTLAVKEPIATGSADSRILYWYLAILEGAGAGQVRLVVGTIGGAPPDWAILPVWDIIPAEGDVWAIGNIFWHADTGDLQWGDPTQERLLRNARPYFNGNPLAQPIEFAVDSTSVNDRGLAFTGANAEAFQARGFDASPALIRMPAQSGTPPQVALRGRRGRTARLRIAGRIGHGADFQVGDSKPRIRQLILEGRTFGRAGST